MKLFQPLYDKALVWARHRHADYYLAGLSFSESMFFPIPPDVMLAPMSLAQPNRAWFFALLTTAMSIIGGLAGYALGYFAFDIWIAPLLADTPYEAKLTQAIGWFEEYGVWVVFLAGFSPIPYKIFTLSAGMLNMALSPFLSASVIGRGTRFFLVAGLMKWGGQPMEAKLREYVEMLGWLVVGLVIIAYFVLR